VFSALAAALNQRPFAVVASFQPKTVNTLALRPRPRPQVISQEGQLSKRNEIGMELEA